MSEAALPRELIPLCRMMLNLKKDDGRAPFVLFLGSATSAMNLKQLERAVLADRYEPSDLSSTDEEVLSQYFQEVWARLGEKDRYSYVCKALRVDAEISAAQGRQGLLRKGYEALAQLIQAGYFDIIFTTSIDPMLDDALADSGLRRSDYTLQVAGQSSVAQMRRALAFEEPRIKIVKLHGDLYARSFTVSDAEVSKLMTPEMKDLLSDYLSRRLMLVSLDGQDLHINDCVARGDEQLYHIGRTRPIPPFNVNPRLTSRGIALVGPEYAFSAFFPLLVKKLLAGLDTLDRGGIHVSKVDDQRLAAIVSNEEPLVELVNNQEFQQLMDLDLVELLETTTFGIELDEDMRFSYQLRGGLSERSERSEVVRIRVDELNEQMRILSQDIQTYRRLGDHKNRVSWRTRAQLEGKRLFSDLFGWNTALMRSLGAAEIVGARGEGLLQFCFSGPRTMLGMPFELLHDAKGPWAVRYPLYRSVTGAPPIEGPNFEELLTRLRQNREPLQVLFIAPRAEGIDPAREVMELREIFQKHEDRFRVKLKIELLLDEAASMQGVCQALEGCRYHIVHFAGHSDFSPELAERSGLGGLFLDGRRSVLTAHQLGSLMRNAQTVLFYLSSCVGAMVGGGHLLSRHAYLGLMDALIMSGVPTVLGYRWNVTDGGSRTFATSFYKDLCKTWSVARAVLSARTTVYRADPDDETWISPILVVQKR